MNNSEFLTELKKLVHIPDDAIGVDIWMRGGEEPMMLVHRHPSEIIRYRPTLTGLPQTTRKFKIVEIE